VWILSGMPLMNIFCQGVSLADKKRQKKTQRNSFVSYFPLEFHAQHI